MSQLNYGGTAAAMAVLVLMALPATAARQKGEVAFNEHCAACHAAGGNLINPAKTLFRKDREKNGLKKPGDLISVMRKPGPGMAAFDTKALPDKEAQEIAEYIIKTFK